MLALGHGQEKDEPVPKKLAFPRELGIEKVTLVAGGGQHSAIIAVTRAAGANSRR